MLLESTLIKTSPSGSFLTISENIFASRAIEPVFSTFAITLLSIPISKSFPVNLR